MKVEKLSIDKIIFDKNHRALVGDVSELMDDIKQHDLLHPITVRKVGRKYELVAGYRRTEAMRKLGRTKIPATIHELSDDEMLFVNLSENIQRKNTTPAEHGFAMVKLRERGYSEKEIAKRLSKSVTYVHRCLQIANEINPKFHKSITLEGHNPKAGEISMAMATCIKRAASNHALTKAQTEKFFEAAIKGQITTSDVKPIAPMLKTKSVEEALKYKEGYTTYRVEFRIDEKTLKRLRKNYPGRGVRELIDLTLAGRIKEKIENFGSKYLMKRK